VKKKPPSRFVKAQREYQVAVDGIQIVSSPIDGFFDMPAPRADFKAMSK